MVSVGNWCQGPFREPTIWKSVSDARPRVLWKGFGRKWYISYNSGRYGPQHIVDNADKSLAKITVKLLFKKYTGETVVD